LQNISADSQHFLLGDGVFCLISTSESLNVLDSDYIMSFITHKRSTSHTER